MCLRSVMYYFAMLVVCVQTYAANNSNCPQGTPNVVSSPLEPSNQTTAGRFQKDFRWGIYQYSFYVNEDYRWHNAGDVNVGPGQGTALGYSGRVSHITSFTAAISHHGFTLGGGMSIEYSSTIHLTTPVGPDENRAVWVKHWQEVCKQNAHVVKWLGEINGNPYGTYAILADRDIGTPSFSVKTTYGCEQP